MLVVFMVDNALTHFLRYQIVKMFREYKLKKYIFKILISYRCKLQRNILEREKYSCKVEHQFGIFLSSLTLPKVLCNE